MSCQIWRGPGTFLRLLFMLNNPSGSATLTEALGSDRVLLGFPGTGGALQDEVVYYVLIAQQPKNL